MVIPMRYFGGKTGALKHIQAASPESRSYTRLIDVMAGGAKVSVRSRELNPDLSIWINDQWQPIYSYLTAVRDDVEHLQKQIRNLMAYLVEDEDQARNYYNAHFYYLDEMEPAEQAVHFFVLMRYAYGANMGSGGFSPMLWKRKQFSIIDSLSDLSDLLQGQEITCLDFREVLAEAGGDDFAYIDPPYSDAVRRKPREKLYRKDDVDVEDVIEAAERSKCQTMVSYDTIPDCVCDTDRWWVEDIQVWHYPKHNRVTEYLLTDYV